jgi:hypothetical protein
MRIGEIQWVIWFTKCDQSGASFIDSFPLPLCIFLGCNLDFAFGSTSLGERGGCLEGFFGS